MLWPCHWKGPLAGLATGLTASRSVPAPGRNDVGNHVDDFLVAGEQSQAGDMMTALGKEFRTTVKDALDGNEHTFLGRSLRCVKPGHIVFGVGQRYIEDASAELGLKKDPTAKKMPTWTKQSAEQLPLDEEQQSRYRSLIDKMVWLDRADIRPAVIRLGSQLRKATDSHPRNAERVLIHLWETR